MDEFEYNRKAYNTIAEAYHQKRQNAEEGAWNDCLEAPAMKSLLKPLVADKKVLDLGCGTGILTRQIVDWGGSPTGVDQSGEMIKQAESLYPEIDFHTASAPDLPFQNHEFDIVASSLVMHYIKDLQPAFDEVSRIVKVGGYFVFSIHHPFQEVAKKDHSSNEVKMGLTPYFHNDAYYWEMCGTTLLSFHHTFEDIISKLSKAGFLVSDLIECRPTEEHRETFKDFEFTYNYPSFCVFQTRKTF